MAGGKNYGMFQSDPGDEAASTDRMELPPASETAESFKPFSGDYLQNPYLFFDKARESEPVFYSPEMDYWVVLKYDDIATVYRDPETYSPVNARHPVTPICPAAAAVRDKQDLGIEPSLVDEPADTHKHHRKIFGTAFTPKRVNQMEERIRVIVDRYIDRFIDDGRAELVSQMLYEVPALAIFLFLGANDEDAVFVKKLGSDRAIVNWGSPSETEQIAMMHGMGEHWQFTKDLVDRAYKDPGDNYLGDMVRIHQEDPSLFTINYLYNVMFLMQFAGHETTTQASANGLRHLLTNRKQWELLCAQPELIGNAVEEILRIDSSIFAWRRLATKESTLGGVTIPKGARILMMMGSGNHDEDMFPDGSTFDATRKNAKKHLSLGLGAHFCMGAPLARLEMRVILEQLTKRLPQLRLVEGQQWEYLPTLVFRGVQRLEVEWS
jgi:cytochrome P450